MLSPRPFVVACCPAKNRAWSIGEWVRALVAQSTPPDVLYILINDEDYDRDTALYPPTIAAAHRAAAESATPIVSSVFNTGLDGDSRVTDNSRGATRYIVSNLAAVRNALLTRVLRSYPQATHIWSVDSDVLPHRDCLALLLDAHLPVVSAVVRNSPEPGVLNFWCDTRRDEVTNRPTPARSFGGERELKALTYAAPQLVTMTGACTLIRRDVLDEVDAAGQPRVRYAYDPRGEDVAFSVAAQQCGFLLAVEPRALTSHLQPNGERWTWQPKTSQSSISEPVGFLSEASST